MPALAAGFDPRPRRRGRRRQQSGAARVVLDRVVVEGERIGPLAVLSRTYGAVTLSLPARLRAAPAARPPHPPRRAIDKLLDARRCARSLAIGHVVDERGVVAPGHRIRRLRATRDVDDRSFALLLDDRPRAALPMLVLGEGHRSRFAVAAEADLDHLPVPLVQPEPEERLVVPEVEEPVLKPDSALSIDRDVPADDIVVWGPVHFAARQHIVLAELVEVVALLDGVAARVLACAEEAESQLWPAATGLRRRQHASVAAPQHVHLLAVRRDAVRHDRRRVGEEAALRVVGEDGAVALEELRVGGRHVAMLKAQLLTAWDARV